MRAVFNTYLDFTNSPTARNGQLTGPGYHQMDSGVRPE